MGRFDPQMRRPNRAWLAKLLQAASERFRTSAGNFDVSQVFMHFQETFKK